MRFILSLLLVIGPLFALLALLPLLLRAHQGGVQQPSAPNFSSVGQTVGSTSGGRDPAHKH